MINGTAEGVITAISTHISNTASAVNSLKVGRETRFQMIKWKKISEV